MYISQIMLDQYNFISDIRFCKILCLGGNIAFIILIQTFPYLKMQSKKISRLYLAINGNYIISLCKVRFSVIFGQNQRASKKNQASTSINPFLTFKELHLYPLTHYQFKNQHAGILSLSQNLGENILYLIFISYHFSNKGKVVNLTPNRIFIYVNSIYRPFVNPILMNTTYNEKWVTPYAILCQK